MSTSTATRKTVPGNGKPDSFATDQVTNGGEFAINACRPYIARVTLEGCAPFIYHAWDCDSIEEKGKAAKGSAAKKTDDLESYVNRCGNNEIGVPGTYLRGAICGANGAAKYRQDPRSPRKSALDLFKAGVQVITPIASFGKKTWDYVDRRRHVVQRAGITRTCPAFLEGWRLTFEIQVVLPEYIPSQLLHAVLVDAGRLCGLGDLRPTYGRFNVVHFDVVQS